MPSIFSVAIIVCACTAATARAQCTKDTDCKGSRICAQGVCVDPPAIPMVVGAASPAATVAPTPVPLAPPAQASPPTAPYPPSYPPGQAPVAYTSPYPQWPSPYPVATASPYTLARPVGPERPWFRGYGTIAPLLNQYVWSGRTGGSALGLGTKGGLHLAGLGVIRPSFHLGGFFAYYVVEGVDITSFGLSLKAGGKPGSLVWLGFALDLGPQFLNSMNMGYAFNFHPRIEVEVMVLKTSGFKMGVLGTLGVNATPYIDPGEGWLVSPATMIGLMIGG